jgi:hypothetical protein
MITMQNTKTTDPEINSGRKSRSHHEKNSNRRGVILAAAALTAAGVAAGVFAASHGNAAPHKASKQDPGVTRELNGTPAQSNALVAETAEKSASIIINAFNDDPKDFNLVKGTGPDRGFELLQTKKNPDVAAVLVPATDGAHPQADHAAYVHWTGIGATDEVYDVSKSAQAGEAMGDLSGATLPTDLVQVPMGQGPQMEASDSTGKVFAASEDGAPSTNAYDDDVVAVRRMADHPPLNLESGAPENAIDAAEPYQADMQHLIS